MRSHVTRNRRRPAVPHIILAVVVALNLWVGWQACQVVAPHFSMPFGSSEAYEDYWATMPSNPDNLGEIEEIISRMGDPNGGYVGGGLFPYQVDTMSMALEPPQPAVVDMLIAAGADPNRDQGTGAVDSALTPLRQSIVRSSDEDGSLVDDRVAVTEILLDAGADACVVSTGIGAPDGGESLTAMAARIAPDHPATALILAKFPSC